VRAGAQSGGLPPAFAAAPELTDAELERAIVEALRKDLDDIAKTLSAQLKERQRQRVNAELSKVVDIAGARRKR
jgi:hypothetical protein